MSDLKKLISYLRLYRRSERAEQHESRKNLLQLAPIIDDLDFTTTDENDLVIIPKERISNSFYYVSLSLIPNQSILLISREQGAYTYYVKHPVSLTYKQLPGGNWIQEEELPEEYIELEESFQDLYFDLRRKIVFRVLLESAFLFPDWFLYAPEEDAVFKQFKNQETLRLEGSYDLGYEEMPREIFGVIVSPDSIKESISVIQRRYKKREVVFFKNPKSGKVYLIPRFDFSKPHRLFYPYVEIGVPFSSAVHRFDEPALGFTFNHHHALLTYLNETLFRYAEDSSFFDTPPRTTFFKEYVIYVSDLLRSNDPIISLTVFLYVPTFVFKEFDINDLWLLLEQLSGKWINERSLPKESIVLQLLKAIYGHYEEKHADRFLLELLDKQVKDRSLIQQLFYKIDGDNFEQLVRFLWGVWKRSQFIYPDIETNPDYKDTDGPIFLPYRSEKQFGFYFTSLSVKFIKNDKLEVIYGTNSYKTIDINLPEKIGLNVPKEAIDIFKPIADLLPNEIKIEKKETVTYHPFYPVYLIKTDGEQNFVFEDLKNESLMPAFVLQANELKSFWSNVATGGEYAVDILTTLSGVGNIAKFRHLSKIATRAEKLRFVSQTGKNLSKGKATVAGAAAVVEISSGTINALIKLTGFNDTPFGKALQDFLFYLELLSLSGELTVAIHNGLRINAKKLVDKPEDAAKLEKHLDDVVVKGELDEVGKRKVLEELYEVADISLLNRGRLTGQVLDEIAISKIKSFLFKNKVELQIGKEKGVFEVEGYFYPSGKTVIMEPKNAAMFITDGVKMKMVLRENATVLEFLHEFMHFKHCKSLGIKNYYNLKGVDGLITRERYVFDKLIEHKQYLNRGELEHSKRYMNGIYKKNGITDNMGNPIIADYNFDINQIPKKRQEVNIDKLLNLK